MSKMFKQRVNVLILCRAFPFRKKKNLWEDKMSTNSCNFPGILFLSRAPNSLCIWRSRTVWKEEKNPLASWVWFPKAWSPEGKGTGKVCRRARKVGQGGLFYKEEVTLSWDLKKKKGGTDVRAERLVGTFAPCRMLSIERLWHLSICCLPRSVDSLLHTIVFHCIPLPMTTDHFFSHLFDANAINSQHHWFRADQVSYNAYL